VVLFEVKLYPLQFLKKSVVHETYEARRLTLDITTGGTADLRAGVNLTEDGCNPFSAVVRGVFATNILVNLMTYTDYSL
ncbi:AvrE-family type 3 secretion system effector, partial [Pseudomonas syringae pv. tagetis]|uniref:AvrE-family type 3 secretion system effector n=1 Tax=Pseudomonas syringae group genomosp. 7 TaxID=251699 RepID=UPI0037705707